MTYYVSYSAYPIGRSRGTGCRLQNVNGSDTPNQTKHAVLDVQMAHKLLLWNSNFHHWRNKCFALGHVVSEYSLAQSSVN